MATIRVTRELLEYALDLPEGIALSQTRPPELAVVDGVECFLFTTAGGDETIPSEGTYALQYEEAEDGLHLVSAVPVEQPGD